MKKSICFLFLTGIVLLLTTGCDSDKKLDPDQGCFSHSPLKTISWAKTELAYFQRPKSGPLRVVVYSYKKERFLAFENLTLSSPMSHIFDCSGNTTSQRGIHYNDFTTDAQALKVLLNEKY